METGIYMKRAILTVTLGLVGSATALSATLFPATAGASAQVAVDSRDDAIAAAALAKDYNLDMKTAYERVASQPKVFALDRELVRDVPSYAGTYIDQSDGGTVVVHAASDDGVEQAEQHLASSGLSTRGRVIRVARSIGDLQSDLRDAAPAADAARDGAAEPVQLSVSIKDNAVLLALPTRGSSAKQRAFVDDRVARGGGRYKRAQARGAGNLQGTCNFPSCDPPLRAGLFISSAGQASGAYQCTSGYVATGPDGVPFLLTAGHCLYSQKTWWEKFNDGSGWHEIGSEHAPTAYDPSNAHNAMDAGILTTRAGWSPQKIVYVNAQNGAYPTAPNPGYTIQADGSSASLQGMYVCLTGSTGGTNCGEYLYNGAMNSGVDNLGVVRMNSCEGDSGGPVYVNHTAFGIESSGGDPTYYVVGPGGGTQKCSNYSYFQGISAVEARYGVKVY